MKIPSYAVIMAGGHGTRFWPLSRSERPKHLLKIYGSRTLLRETVDRVLPLFKRKGILVVALSDHLAAVRRELPMLGRSSFLAEPQANNTAACIGLAAMELAARERDAIMVILPADHWISDMSLFRRTVRTAVRQAEERDVLVTLGVRPTYPETGYGYIKRGKKAEESGFYQVKAFAEKPPAKIAARWIRSGSLWNAGIFVWRASTILHLMQRYIPRLYRNLKRIQDASEGKGLGRPSPSVKAALRKAYRRMPRVSIDQGLLEKLPPSKDLVTLEATFGWSDLGSWDALYRLLPHDRKGNAAVGKWLGVGTTGSLAFSSGRLVVLLGMKDTFVVDSPDALLVGNLNRAQELRKVVAELEKRGYKRLLK